MSCEGAIRETLQQALAFHQEGRLDEAARAYRSILGAAPDQVEALHYLGVLEAQQGYYDAALGLIDRAVKLAPQSMDARLSRVKVLTALNRPDEALAGCDAALAPDANSPAALYHRGNVLVELNRHDEALASYQRLLTITPGNAAAHYNLGVVLLSLRRYEEALANYDRALEADSADVEVLTNRGVALYELLRYEEALASYDRALAIRPDFAEALNNRANVLRELNRHAEVLESCDRALAIRPDYVEALNNRGLALHAMSRNTEALASFRQALTIQPAFAETHNNLGLLLRAEGTLDEALAAFHQALALKPDFAAACENLAGLLKEEGRLEEAAAAYRQMLVHRPQHADGHNTLGLVLQELGRPGEAAAAFRRAVAVQPDFAVAGNNLGLALRSLGKRDEAIAAYRQAISSQPDLAEAHSNLGNVLLDQGRAAEAEACFRQAVELAPTSVHANINLSVALNQLVPAWHIPMMNDDRRNAAYLEALRAAVGPDSDVLEIGTGSGLLAMIAARFGARHVVTCEAVPLIAATAREIVADNGLQASIDVVAKKSTDMTVGVELPRRANLMVSEILSSELLAEGVLPSLEDAKRRLLEPGARIIPAAGSIVFALFTGDAIKKHARVDHVLGFDLTRFNAIVAARRFVMRDDLDIELLTATTEAFAFDFAGCNYFPAARKTLRVPITAAGRCYGVAQWLRLNMDDRITYENHPSARTPAATWQTCLYRFSAPVDVEPGQVALVHAEHNRSAAWFSWGGLEEPAPT